MTEVSNEASPAVPELLQEGARLYNRGEFWEAHEAWEEAWLTLRDRDATDRADLVQGLILATAAFENLERGKPGGFATQGAKALHRLRRLRELCPEIGVTNADVFYEALLGVYLEVQRYKHDSLADLERGLPELVVEREKR